MKTSLEWGRKSRGKNQMSKKKNGALNEALYSYFNTKHFKTNDPRKVEFAIVSFVFWEWNHLTGLEKLDSHTS